MEQNSAKEESLTDRDFNVFKSIVKVTSKEVWQYFYNDENDLNQHSQYFETKELAIKGYESLLNSKLSPTEVESQETLQKAYLDCMLKEGNQALLNKFHLTRRTK